MHNVPRLIILDRDGVLNVDREDYVKSPAELILLDGVVAAIARLTTLGKIVVVATNQACIGRGIVPESAVLSVHEELLTRVRAGGGEIAKIYYCPDATHTPRRKPAPGMLLEAMQEFGATVEETIMVGDAARDITAGFAAGVKSYLVRTGKGLESLEMLIEARTPPTAVYDDLAALVQANFSL